MYSKAVVGFLACSLLAGCVLPENTVQYQVSSQYVAVSEVVGVIKCAFALALKAENPDYPRLNNNVAVLEFEFKVVDESSVGGSVAANKAEPFVFAVGAGTGSILPKFGASVTRSNTVITRIYSRLGLRYVDDRVCESVSMASRQSAGFEARLASLITQLDVQSDKSPYGIVDKLNFESNFGVLRKRNAGLGIDFVFFGGSVEAAADRNDIQSLKITIQAPSKDIPYPEVELYERPLRPQQTEKASVGRRPLPRMVATPSTSSNQASPVGAPTATTPEARPICRPKNGGLGCLTVPAAAK